MEKNKNKKLKDIIDVWNPKKDDPLGSYTGVPSDYDRPIQDADDL